MSHNNTAQANGKHREQINYIKSEETEEVTLFYNFKIAASGLLLVQQHKWCTAPLDCSMFLVSKRLKRSFLSRKEIIKSKALPSFQWTQDVHTQPALTSIRCNPAFCWWRFHQGTLSSRWKTALENFYAEKEIIINVKSMNEKQLQTITKRF